MKTRYALILILLMAGCAELPEARMSEPIPVPGRTSPLSRRTVPFQEDRLHLKPVDGSLSGLLGLVDASPALEALKHEISREAGTAIQGSLSPNPVLGFETEMMPFDDPGFGKARNKIRLSQRIEVAGKAKSRVEIALANKDEAEAKFYSERATLLTQTARDYYKIVYAGFGEEYAQRLLDLRKTVLERAQELNATGRISEKDLIPYRVELHQAEVRLKSFQAEKRKTLRNLEGRLGLKAETIQACTGQRCVQPIALSMERAENDILSLNPSLIVLDRKVAAALARRDAADSKAYPDLNVGVSYVRGFNQRMERDDFFGAFVELPFPLVDRNQGGIQAADADIRMAESDLLAAGYRLIDEWHGLVEERQVMLEQREIYSHQIELLRQEQALIDQQVEAGRESIFKLLQVRIRIEEAELLDLALEEKLVLLNTDLLNLTGRNLNPACQG
ncbi:MAG: TolC family protein [Planctomycetota bacterium]